MPKLRNICFVVITSNARAQARKGLISYYKIQKTTNVFKCSIQKSLLWKILPKRWCIIKEIFGGPWFFNSKKPIFLQLVENVLGSDIWFCICVIEWSFIQGKNFITNVAWFGGKTQTNVCVAHLWKIHFIIVNFYL
jgi:hypothetical protein